MRLAIVTGGSKGLGKALCLDLERSGYQLLEFSRGAPFPFSTRVDLAAPEDARRTVRETLEPIDPDTCTELLLFSNAGTLSPIGPAWRQEPSELISNLNTNLASAILVIAECMRHFRDAPCPKMLVNISSGAALKGNAGWSLYCAAKAGMEGFVRAVAAEERHQQHPFLAISVDPGVMDTDMQTLIRSTAAADFPDVERFRKRKDDGHLATPESVARAIARLIARRDLESGGRYDAFGEA